MGSLKRCHSNSSNEWSRRMPEGIDLEVSHHPLTMKKVGNLIIALERLKGSMSKSVLSTNFGDNMLRSMLDSFMEVCDTYSTPPPLFEYTGEHVCSVMDSEKRNLVKTMDCMELHAVLLQGSSSKQKVKLNMSNYVHPTATPGRPVVLGIKDTNFYLSCHQEGDDEPTLHLEEVEDKSSLRKISNESQMLRFLFYEKVSGVNSTTLMSACSPDWYISTVEEDDKPVIMCQQESNCYQTFTIERESYTPATDP